MEIEPSVPHQTHDEVTKEATKAIEQREEGSMAQPLVTEVQTLSPRDAKLESDQTQMIFMVEDFDEYKMRPADGRVDSGFATHFDLGVAQHETPAQYEKLII